MSLLRCRTEDWSVWIVNNEMLCSLAFFRNGSRLYRTWTNAVRRCWNNFTSAAARRPPGRPQQWAVGGELRSKASAVIHLPRNQTLVPPQQPDDVIDDEIINSHRASRMLIKHLLIVGCRDYRFSNTADRPFFHDFLNLEPVTAKTAEMIYRFGEFQPKRVLICHVSESGTSSPLTTQYNSDYILIGSQSVIMAATLRCTSDDARQFVDDETQRFALVFRRSHRPKNIFNMKLFREKKCFCN